MNKKPVAIDVTRIPPRPPILHHKVQLAEMLARDCLRVIKAVRGDLMGAKEAVEFISMKRGVAAALDAENTFLQKVYKLGAGMPGLVIFAPVELEKVRRHDLLFDFDGQVFDVVKAPSEEPPWKTDWPGEVVVYSQPGETLTFTEGSLKGWGWLSYHEGAENE